MSEPMPGEVPAQQDGDSADPAEFPGTAEPVHPGYPVQEAGSETPAEHREPREPRDVAGPADAAGQSGHRDVEDAPEAEDDDGPRPLGLHVEPTGHAPVDAQMQRLDDADYLAVSGHLEVYEDVHRGLRDTLTALDRPAPGPAPGPGREAPGHPYPRS